MRRAVTVRHRVSTVSDRQISLFEEYGGPQAAHWARTAQAHPVHNRTSAKIIYICMLRAMGSAIDYERYVPDSARDKLRWVWDSKAKHTGIPERRESPLKTIQWLVVGHEQALENMYPGLERETAPPRSMYASETARFKWRCKNARRRMSTNVRKAYNRWACVEAECRADSWSYVLRHPSASTLQQTDDNELRREGSRVY